MQTDITRDMLQTIRRLKEDVQIEDKAVKIVKSHPQFGELRISQEKSLRDTIREDIEFGEDALVYYPTNKNLVLVGKITSLNLKFKFVYNDPSGDGCYIWAEATQLTKTNLEYINKCRDAFDNWKDSLISDASIIEDLDKFAKSN